MLPQLHLLRRPHVVPDPADQAVQLLPLGLLLMGAVVAEGAAVVAAVRAHHLRAPLARLPVAGAVEAEIRKAKAQSAVTVPIHRSFPVWRKST